MTALWTSAAIAAATGGRESAPFAAAGVTFDSREVTPGDLFVALRGAHADGHDHAAAALANGAAGCLSERDVPGPHVRVADTMVALRSLGAAARARTAATIVGVTGSVGKTGCKEALRRAFARMAPDHSHASEKSYNNHSGVPLSLARMPAEARFGVFEIGMNHSGEIQPLAAMVRPHVALVTWVAGAHLAFLGSEEAIAAAKAEIFEGVVPGGTAIWPADNPHAPVLRAKAEAFGLRPLSFGEGAGADVRLRSAVPGADGTDIVADVAGEELHFRVGMAGRHWVSNALAVLAAVHAAGGDIAEAGLALAGLTGLPGRGERLVVPVSGGTATILDESYNANPASMAAALAVLAAMPGRRLALLGDMRELGERSPALHAGIAAPLAAAGVAEAALVGPEIAVLEHDGATRLADWAAALAWARATLKPGDVLLVKGSNGVGLGRVVAGLQQEQPA